MPQPNDLSRSLVALDQNSTIIAVIEMSRSSWLVAGMLPGIERQPRKKLEPSPERRNSDILFRYAIRHMSSQSPPSGSTSPRRRRPSERAADGRIKSPGAPWRRANVTQWCHEACHRHASFAVL